MCSGTPDSPINKVFNRNRKPVSSSTVHPATDSTRLFAALVQDVCCLSGWNAPHGKQMCSFFHGMSHFPPVGGAVLIMLYGCQALIMICCLSGVMSAALPVVGPNETSDNRAANPYVGGRPYVPPPPVPQPPIQMPVQSGPPLYPNLPIPGALPIYPNPPVPGGPSGFGPQGSAFHLVGNQLPGAEMRITDTNVDCQKTIMIATFK